MRGAAPLLVSVPHSGSLIPDELHAHFRDEALGSQDTDWFMEELYGAIVKRLGGSMISPLFSRYVIDLNRPENDESLYPGQTTTGLCPTQRFDGAPLYHNGKIPDLVERERRIELYWRPYHHALQAELDRLLSLYGVVLLWEGHSIKSIVPRLFEGQLTDLNLGTNDGKSCDPLLEKTLIASLDQIEVSTQTKAYSSVLNGRFKGGYITRNYGLPHRGVNAIQLELSQRVYLADEDHPSWDPRHASGISELIESLISKCLETLMSDLRPSLL